MAMVGDTLRRVEIRFPLTFSAIASVIFLGMAYWYWREADSTKDWLVFVAVGATAVGQITASFYTARVLGLTLNKEARDIARETATDTRDRTSHQFMLKKEALRFGERWNSSDMVIARDVLRNIIAHRNKTTDQLLVFIQENETSVHHIMNFLEEMATCCRHGVVDVALAKDQFDAVVLSAWEALFPWVRKKRQEGFPSIWEDTETLYDKWKRP